MGLWALFPARPTFLKTLLSIRHHELRVKDICLHEEEEEGAGDGRQGPRVCYGKSMSAMHGLFGGGICGPEHCCSLDIELGRDERGGGNHPPKHCKCVYVREHTQANTFLTHNTHPAAPTSLQLCFILTVNTWPKQEPLSICEL